MDAQRHTFLDLQAKLLNQNLYRIFRRAKQGNATKAEALREAEAVLTQHFDRILPYVLNVKVKKAFKGETRDLTDKEKETLKSDLISGKLEDFKKILNDL